MSSARPSPAMAASNSLYAMADDAYWLDTGTPQLYLRANVDILKGRNTQHRFEGIVDGSWRAASATIDASAKLVSSVVDWGCVVGADVVLEDSVLLPGAVVQSSCEIRSSIMAPRPSSARARSSAPPASSVRRSTSRPTRIFRATCASAGSSYFPLKKS